MTEEQNGNGRRPMFVETADHTFTEPGIQYTNAHGEYETPLIEKEILLNTGNVCFWVGLYLVV